MHILELSIFTAAGMVVSFGVGFFIGLGYQNTEHKATIRKLRREHDRFVKEVEKLSIKSINDAYAMGRRHEREDAQQRVEQEWQLLVHNLEQETEEIKFGGF